MALEPLPPGFGDMSIITMDASFWAVPPLLHDLHCLPQEVRHSVEEVKQMLAAATAELEAARQEVRRKEQNIAALVELLRRTAEERDQLRRQQQHLLLARDLAAAAVVTPSSSDSDWSFTPSSSSPAAVDSSTLFQPTSASNADVIVYNMPVPLELLATKRPLPQQGQLLQAVMEAGPLLQNLMVAAAVAQPAASASQPCQTGASRLLCSDGLKLVSFQNKLAITNVLMPTQANVM